MKIALTILILITIGLSGYCGTAGEGNTKDWIESSLMRIPEFNNGWNMSPLSGGTSIDGASFDFSLHPIKESSEVVKKEFIALMKDQLQKDGYSIVWDGFGTGNGQITSSTIRVRSEKYLGTIEIAFFPEMHRGEILGIAAIAQIPRHE